MGSATIREAVGVFHDERSLRAAADDLMISGFDRSDLSLMAGHRTVERKLGRMYAKVAELQDDPDVPCMAYIGTDSRTEGKAAIIGGLVYVGAVAAAGMVVASGGTAAAVLIGAAAAGGAGGLIGAVFSRFIDGHHAGYLQAQIDRGGLILWVRTGNAARERRACEILRRHSAEDVHVHELPAVEYRSEGGVAAYLSYMRYLDSKRPAPARDTDPSLPRPPAATVG